MLLRVSLPVGFGLLMVAGIVRTENATEKPKERRLSWDKDCQSMLASIQIETNLKYESLHSQLKIQNDIITDLLKEDEELWNQYRLLLGQQEKSKTAIEMLTGSFQNLKYNFEGMTKVDSTQNSEIAILLHEFEKVKKAVGLLQDTTQKEKAGSGEVQAIKKEQEQEKITFAQDVAKLREKIKEMEVSNGCESGVEKLYPHKHPQRTAKKYIIFKREFATTPSILLAFASLDLKDSAVHHVEVRQEAATKDSFSIVAMEWDSTQSSEVGVSWMACPRRSE